MKTLTWVYDFGDASNQLGMLVITFDTMYNRKALSLQPWPQAKTMLCWESFV